MMNFDFYFDFNILEDNYSFYIESILWANW
jgi:hypothetical protein